VPASEDPGFMNDTRLYVFAGDKMDGSVTICYQVDEVQACQPDAVKIISRTRVFLPSILKSHDFYGATATATRRRPTIQSLDAVP
jgi:hypothetical protein